MQTRPFACNGVVCCDYKHIDHIQPHNNFPAQSLHFRFGSVAPCPTLKSDVTASTPRTRYRRLASPYPTGFSCYIQSAYKSKQSFLRSHYILYYTTNCFFENYFPLKDLFLTILYALEPKSTHPTAYAKKKLLLKYQLHLVHLQPI